jgi:hypothetical protein
MRVCCNRKNDRAGNSQGMYRSTAAAAWHWMIYGMQNGTYGAVPREALQPPIAIDSYDTQKKAHRLHSWSYDKRLFGEEERNNVKLEDDF